MDTLNRVLEARKMSATELARRVNLNTSSITRWMQGIRSPRMRNIAAIEKALNVELCGHLNGQPLFRERKAQSVKGGAQ